MDTKALEYILEIAQCRSITKAAQALGISQSALSQILLRIEREESVTLFTRHKRALKLTEAGELYVDTARKIVDLRNKLTADLKDLSESRPLRLAVTSHWGMVMMKDILPKFHELFPDQSVELKQYGYTMLREEFQRYRVDIAAGTLYDRDALPENCQLLRWEEMVLIISCDHPFAKKHSHEEFLSESVLKELDGVSFIRSTAGSTTRHIEDALFERIGLKMRPFCEITDYSAFVSLVEANLGFAFVSADYIEGLDSVCHWHLDPKMARRNALYIRPGLQIGECEKFLIDSIKNYKLFK